MNDAYREELCIYRAEPRVLVTWHVHADWRPRKVSTGSCFQSCGNLTEARLTAARWRQHRPESLKTQRSPPPPHYVWITRDHRLTGSWTYLETDE